MNRFNVSIIVPIFNEADQVTDLMQRLTLLNDYVTDIIIVDGGSTDGCNEQLAKKFTVISSEKG